MRTLLIGLDNPYSRNPDDALLPMPAGATGDKLVKLIDEVTGKGIDYTSDLYMRDFARMNLYTGEAARSGKGATATDRLLARQAMILIAEAQYTSVVLFGKRVQTAFSDFMRFADGPIDKVSYGSAAIHPSIYFYALPHPSGRNHWYALPNNRLAAGAILETLRDRR